MGLASPNPNLRGQFRREEWRGAQRVKAVPQAARRLGAAGVAVAQRAHVHVREQGAAREGAEGLVCERGGLGVPWLGLGLGLGLVSYP